MTGGISQVEAVPSQPQPRQPAARFSAFPRADDHGRRRGRGAQAYKTYYSEMQMTGSRVLATGPAVRSDPDDGGSSSISRPARRWRDSGAQEVRLAREGGRRSTSRSSLDVQKKAEGDPWSNYYCAGFAWKDSTRRPDPRAVQIGAHPVGEQGADRVAPLRRDRR